MELKNIKGLGNKRIETLINKGIESVEDLALYFPKTYYDLNSKESFEEDGKYKLLKVDVISDVKVSRIRQNFSYSYCECLDITNKKFKAIWYNQPYIKNAIQLGDKLFLYGKNSNTKHNYFIVSNFRNQAKIAPETQLLPIYKPLQNIGQTVLTDSIKQALNISTINSLLPKEIENKFFKTNLNEAINLIHYPNTLEDLNQAKQRLDVEKILPFIKINDDIKNNKNTKKPQKYTNFNNIYKQFCDFLPYKLTNYQIDILSDIRNDMLNNTCMNRLVQGDVGAGKTIISLIPCAYCVASGYSAIFITPTEILAHQHYTLAKEYFDKLGLKTLFLSSSSTALEKREVFDSFNKSEPCLLIGTHSCLNNNLNIDNVSLMVVDEQHRFGVKQRSVLLDRKNSIDFLMLSATPIPRSLSLVYYGGLDVSILEKPPKTKQIQTNIIPQKKEDDMWEFIRNKTNNGSKAFVVCSNIDDMDDDSYQGLSANSMYSILCEKFSKNEILLAHGKMDSKTEKTTLEMFKQNKYKILVATTIVEVGVDIPEADIIVIVSPEKFGLATLHQLRGRVGRAGQQSYCFCLSRNLTENSLERINFFKNNLNGFDIAEFDYKSRGCGNLIGTNQHGKTENIFEFISLESYNLANKIFNDLKLNYNTNQLFFNNKTYNLLSLKNLN